MEGPPAIENSGCKSCGFCIWGVPNEKHNFRISFKSNIENSGFKSCGFCIWGVPVRKQILDLNVISYVKVEAFAFGEYLMKNK
jgi:hypothetical protein